jgi:hypothetical protein
MICVYIVDSAQYNQVLQLTLFLDRSVPYTLACYLQWYFSSLLRRQVFGEMKVTRLD